MARKPKTPTPKTPPKGDVKAAADRAEKRSKGEASATPKVAIDPKVITAEEIAEAITTKMGRPTKYKHEYAAVAKALCRRGATDFELAEEFDVSTSTIWRWQCQQEGFRSALREGRDGFDDRVERSLAQRAIGYTYHTEKVFQYQGDIVRAKTAEHVPPDVGAAKLWLTNRRPAEWREATQRIEHGQPGDFETMSDEDLKNYILSEQEMLQESKRVSRGKPSTKH